MPPTKRTHLKRIPKRGVYDKETIHAILDAAYLCHIGFVHEGYPVVIPTLYGREKDLLFIHGAASSRLLRNLQSGIEVSVAVTLVDGIVLARSAFHHSMNYRSVVLFGKAGIVDDEKDKIMALKAISDQVIPHRWEEVRPPHGKELKATTVLWIPINEASAKVRTGPPVDEKEDYGLNIWAGELPVKRVFDAPVRDPLLKEGIPLSESIRRITGRS
jgi:nitroimidazol reductase NimA-like FMN-containing flavoprotein (pyridoxamine 5'-phosphate oxidase superfamily)